MSLAEQDLPERLDRQVYILRITHQIYRITGRSLLSKINIFIEIVSPIW